MAVRPIVVEPVRVRPISAGPVSTERNPHGGVTLSLIAQDSFDRANNASSLGNADLGGAWTAHLGTWGIDANQGRLQTADPGGINLATLTTTKSDVQHTVTFSGNIGQSWSVFRLVDASNYMLVSAQDANTVKLFSVVATSFTELGSAAQVWADGDVVQVYAQGTSITVRVNGVTKIATSSSDNLTAVKHGLGTGGSGSANLYNDLTIYSIS